MRTAAAVRRRGLATSAAWVGLLVIVGGVLAQLPTAARGQVSAPAPRFSVAAFAHSPQTFQRAATKYLKHRNGQASVAVYDDVAGRLMVARPLVRARTASIVKVDILETLLHRTHGHLTDDQRAAARAMIEQSSNDAANTLWQDAGGESGVGAYNDRVGLTQTRMHPVWGLTETSAADQVALVRTLLRPSSLITSAGRGFERRLMRHVEPDQRWGITGGVPATATVGIKDGWVPVRRDDNRWAVNSIGWVRGDGRRYEIAVLTEHQTTEAYAIKTIEHIAGLAWRHVAVAHRHRR